MRVIFRQTHDSYGARRMMEALSDHNIHIGKYRTRRLMNDNQLIVKRSKKHKRKINSNCYDNAPMESLFKTLKAECVWRTKYQTRTQAKNPIGHYINSFYNTVRKHSFLNYKSPMQFERINMIKTDEMAA